MFGTVYHQNYVISIKVGLTLFKKELCVSLLNILQSENEYIGVPELITRLPKVKYTVLFFHTIIHNLSL